MNDVNVNDYDPNRNRKILTVFDDMIADIMTNKKFEAIIKELFIRCRKLNISLALITQCYFSFPKEVRLNSTHYLIIKIHNKRELQIITINHWADIDYKDFMKIYRKRTSEPYSFLTIDTTLPANNFFKIKKKSFRFIIKMTLTDELKILDDKIKENQAQYDLDREAAKISALSSRELDKYEYLNGRDSGVKPGAVEKVKFEYSPLGEVLSNKAKSKADKRNKVLNTDKQNENFIYTTHHIFVKFKNISDFKELSLDSMRKNWIICIKNLLVLKMLVRKQKIMKI